MYEIAFRDYPGYMPLDPSGGGLCPPYSVGSYAHELTTSTAFNIADRLTCLSTSTLSYQTTYL